MEEESMMEILFNNADWATKGVTSTRITIAWHLIAPLVRVAAAVIVSYMAAGLRPKPRLTSALVTATLSAFLTYAYLLPLMLQGHTTGRDVEFSHVALAILAFYAALVGGAVGSLLPRPMGGVTLGCAVAVALVTLLPRKLVESGGLMGDFVLWGPVLAAVGGVLATR